MMCPYKMFFSRSHAGSHSRVGKESSDSLKYVFGCFLGTHRQIVAIRVSRFRKLCHIESFELELLPNLPCLETFLDWELPIGVPRCLFVHQQIASLLKTKCCRSVCTTEADSTSASCKGSVPRRQGMAGVGDGLVVEIASATA